jgi:hypothetical protein
MQQNGKPTILVTGSPRSGTTWVGQMLAAAPRTGYVHEPFNWNARPIIFREPLNYWFQFISDQNSEKFTSAIRDTVAWKYPLRRNLADAASLGQMISALNDERRFFLHRRRGDRQIIKDPIAIFSAEWLAETFDMNVLVLLRHPAAFCSSIKIKNWRTDFNTFLNQPLLMEKYLRPYESDLVEHVREGKDIISNAILLWNCIHHTISIYRNNHPEWLFVKHEDLSIDPVNQFRSIYDAFGLEFTQNAESEILNSSGAHNPVEQQANNEFVRNSKENIYNWKSRLSESEVARIKSETSRLWPLFYSEEEW